MSFFKKTIAALAALLIFFASATPQSEALSIREERELADEFLKAVYAYYDIVDDHVINDYVTSLGEKLIRGVPRQPFEFRFHVIREDTFNAFAGPGGNIFIFSGLVEALDTENELAAIMAHEIAHVTGRHVPEMIARSKKTSFASMAGVIAGILIGLGGAPAAGAALSLGSMAAGQTMMLAYSRENELQADFLGLRYLTDAGYHEYGMLSALKKIRSREWFGEDEVPTYLKTHPAAAERMAMLGNTIPEAPEKLKNTYEYDRMRARTMALYGKRGNNLERLSRMAATRPDDPAVQYGLGLAYAEGGNPEKAVFHLKQAAALKTGDDIITVALGRAFFLAGENQAAADALSRIENLAQYGPEGLRTMGRVQMAEGNTRDAVKTFKTLLDHYPGDRQTLLFLGQSLGQENRIGEAHYYLGKFHKAKGDLENARFHFNRALADIQDPDQKAEIENSLREMSGTRQRGKPREDTGGDLKRQGLRLIETGKFHGEGPPALGR